ncbi:hypothetical protein J6590_084834 [Homalodisca vitripennis]|nr:hypothetical protein J6590_084834 [Homalodisca vitripennis]
MTNPRRESALAEMEIKCSRGLRDGIIITHYIIGTSPFLDVQCFKFVRIFFLMVKCFKILENHTGKWETPSVFLDDFTKLTTKIVERGFRISIITCMIGQILELSGLQKSRMNFGRLNERGVLVQRKTQEQDDVCPQQVIYHQQ